MDPLSVNGTAAAQVVEAAARRATGAEITRLREALGLTPAELADRTGIAETVVRRYERGNAILVDLWQLRCLAHALGITAGELVDARRSDGDRRPVSSGPNDRGPGRSSVYVLACVSEEPTEVGWRLIRWDPRQLGTHWQAPCTPPAVTRPVLDWAAHRLNAGSAFVAGPANGLTGVRSWFLGTHDASNPVPDQPETPARPAPGATDE